MMFNKIVFKNARQTLLPWGLDWHMYFSRFLSLRLRPFPFLFAAPQGIETREARCLLGSFWGGCLAGLALPSPAEESAWGWSSMEAVWRLMRAPPRLWTGSLFVSTARRLFSTGGWTGRKRRTRGCRMGKCRPEPCLCVSTGAINFAPLLNTPAINQL